GPLENPDLPAVEMSWRDFRHAVLNANLHADQSLRVQVTYHPGWHARVNGESRRVSRDPIGLMMVEPRCEGRCVVDLELGDDVEIVVARMVSWTAVGCAFIWMLLSVPRVRYWMHGSRPQH